MKVRPGIKSNAANQVADAGTPPTAAKADTPAQVVAEKPQQGLIDVPPTPTGPTAQAVDARIIDAPFNSFMKVRRLEVDVQRPGVEGVSSVQCDILNGPGHNCSMAAPIVLDAHGMPSLVLKAGDTRAARVLRGEPYVKLGMIGGRWDKVGADPEKIGVEEIAEEIGAKLVPNGFLSLGDKLVPTMPHESTEADRYFAAVVQLGDEPGVGDESGMEVVGLMKPVSMPVSEAIEAMDSGEVGEGARARVAYQRALDSIGFIPELDAYVHDLPAGLKKRFDTLGLGKAVDLRGATQPAEGGVDGPPPEVHPKATQVDGVAFVSQTDVQISDDAVMMDAKTTHTAGGETVGDPFPNQIFHVSYDRAKLALCYNDPMQGPMVRMDPVERPVLAAKGLALDSERTYKDENTDLVALDVPEIRVDLNGAKGDAIGALADQAMQASLTARGVTAKATRLGASCDASPGQTDMRYHFFGAKIDKPKDTEAFVPLSDAIAACRAGQGDAATEALLLRLAKSESYVPTLRMTVERAQKMA